MSYGHFTDEDLLNAIYIQDRMVTSELELELASRFESQAEEHALSAGMKEVLDDFGIEVHSTDGIEEVRKALQFAKDHDLVAARELMALALEFDIDTADALKPELARIEKIDDLTNDVAEAVALLHAFFNPSPVTT